MRYHQSDGEIFGLTLKSNAVEVWARIRHICCKVESDLMEGESDATRLHVHCKEESKAIE